MLLLCVALIYFSLKTSASKDDVRMVFHAFGRGIAQVVSHWLPIAAAWFRARFRSRRICGGESGTRAGFPRVLGFPLPIFIPPVAPQSPSSIIWGWYNRPVVAAVRSGLSLTPLRIIKKIKNITHLRNIWGSMVTAYRLQVRCSVQVWVEAFIFSTMSRQVLRSIQPPMESVRGDEDKVTETWS
jgi:hypothetical protein